ncbi:MAG: DUF2169 domain-containing protein [Candidatus Thiodiazotropha sp. 6PLUC2]
MEIISSTQFQTGYTLCHVHDGHELLVIITKGTFNIPKQGEFAELTEKQKPLVIADLYSGEPGYSSPLYELDYAPFKRHCDVLLLGSAYAPGGTPVTNVDVNLKLSTLNKSFRVTGSRNWEAGKFAIRPGYPAIFDKMPISYDQAFGGIDNHHKNINKHSAFMKNPVGRGYHLQLNKSFIDGSPMPSTEQLNQPVTIPNGQYIPMSFGPVGRYWTPRLALAGTYDEAWVNNKYPLPPADFDTAYFQAAPVDQQIPYPQGGETVFLQNLTPQGETIFNLPEIEMPVTFFYKGGKQVKKSAFIDTITLEPDESLFTMTWRTYIPLTDSILEIPQVEIGDQAHLH